MALTVNLCDFISILFCILYHISIIFNFLKWRVVIKRRVSGNFLKLSKGLAREYQQLLLSCFSLL